MRNLASFLVVCAITATVPDTSTSQTREVDKTVEFSPGSDLVVDVDRGTFQLTAWDQPKVEIHARIEAPRDVDRDYGEEIVEATRIDIESRTNSLRIKTNFDDIPYEDEGWGFGRNRRIPDVHYVVKAPRSLNMDIHISRNRATIKGFQGDFRFNTDRCDIEARVWVGGIRMTMDRGSLRLQDASGSLDLETDRTDVRIDVLGLTENSRFEADRGEIELAIPGEQGLDLLVDVGDRGGFDSGFSITTRSMRGRRIEGSINGGGPELRFEGDRVNFQLLRK